MVLYSCFISIIILSNYSGILVTLDQRDVDSEVFSVIFRLTTKLKGPSFITRFEPNIENGT